MIDFSIDKTALFLNVWRSENPNRIVRMSLGDFIRKDWRVDWLIEQSIPRNVYFENVISRSTHSTISEILEILNGYISYDREDTEKLKISIDSLIPYCERFIVAVYGV